MSETDVTASAEYRRQVNSLLDLFRSGAISARELDKALGLTPQGPLDQYVDPVINPGVSGGIYSADEAYFLYRPRIVPDDDFTLKLGQRAGPNGDVFLYPPVHTVQTYHDMLPGSVVRDSSGQAIGIALGQGQIARAASWSDAPSTTPLKDLNITKSLTTQTIKRSTV